MRLPIILLLLVFSLSIYSQNFGEYGLQFEEVNCPYDPSIEVEQPVSWEVYQTLDDRWNGTRDSTKCFDFNNNRLDLEQLNTERSLFFRYQFTEGDLSLPPNVVFSTLIELWSNTGMNILDTCLNGICSGALIQYSIPDESGDGRIIRDIKRNFADEYDQFGGYCWPTENSDDILVENFIIKISYLESNLENKTIQLYSAYSNMEYADAAAVGYFGFEETLLEDTVYIGNFQQTAHLLNGDDYFYQYLFVQQSDTLYPSFDNYLYIEARPEVEVSEQKTLILHYQNEDELLFQPFTGIRGGLVAGSDTLRHNLILDYYFSDFCQVFIVDLLIPSNTTYRFASGALEFGQARSCFMFLNGGKLEVKKDETLYYGKNGVGVLGLAHGGYVYLQEGSELVIGNKFLLANSLGDQNKQASVYLSVGSRLVFDENASLSRISEDDFFLDVYMNGGTIDVSNLSEEEQALIHYIYPETNPMLMRTIKQDELFISPNPMVAFTTNIQFAPEHWQKVIDYQLVDLTGRAVDKGELTAFNNNAWYTYTAPDNISPGAYIFIIKLKKGQLAGQLIIQK